MLTEQEMRAHEARCDIAASVVPPHKYPYCIMRDLAVRGARRIVYNTEHRNATYTPGGWEAEGFMTSWSSPGQSEVVFILDARAAPANVSLSWSIVGGTMQCTKCRWDDLDAPRQVIAPLAPTANVKVRLEVGERLIVAAQKGKGRERAPFELRTSWKLLK